jgi:hypothetical protein
MVTSVRLKFSLIDKEQGRRAGHLTAHVISGHNPQNLSSDMQIAYSDFSPF